MKISQETVNVLKNFSTIYPAINVDEKKENKYLKMLSKGKVLSPGGIIKLPFFEKEIRIL